MTYQHMQHTSGKSRTLTHLLKIVIHDNKFEVEITSTKLPRELYCRILAQSISHSHCVRVGTGKKTTTIKQNKLLQVTKEYN